MDCGTKNKVILSIEFTLIPIGLEMLMTEKVLVVELFFRRTIDHMVEKEKNIHIKIYNYR